MPQTGVRPQSRPIVRACLATDSREPSGVGEHMLVLAEELRAELDIVLACPPSRGGRDLLDRAAAAGLGVLLLPDDPDEVTRWLRRHDVALLHVHAGIGWEGHDLAVRGRAAGVPTIMRTEHLPDVITDVEQRELHRAGCRLVDQVITVSDAVARSFHAGGGLDGKAVVIRNGLRGRPARRSRLDVRGALDLDPDAPVVLTVARMTAQKGHDTLIGAWPAVLASRPSARLVLAGDGPLRDSLRERAQALGVGQSILFLGYRDDVPDLLGAADVFALPSLFEGLPLAVLEAMAAGLPVVATATGGTDEAVLDGVSGLLVSPGNAPALAAALKVVLGTPARAVSLGEAGRRRFETLFTAAGMAADTLHLYRRHGVGRIREKDHERMDGTPGARTRIGFIGAGGIAHRHLGVLEQFGDVELVAFADVDRDRATAVAARFGARSYADHGSMLEAEALDALYICIPPFAHGAVEQAALAKRLPFFVEKPLATDLDTAEAIGRAVAEAGLITAVGYHWRYLDTVDEARALLADNPAQFLSGYWLDSTPPPQWWWKQDRSGGQMVEQTTHIVDLIRHLAGEVTQVFGLMGHKVRADFPGLDVATASTASLRFASGAVGNIGSTCLLRWNHRVGLHVFADGLAMEITDHDLMVDVGRGRPVRHAEGDPVWREDRDFIDAVRGGENRIRVPYGEALKTHRLVMAIGRSAATGLAVDLQSQRDAAHV